MASVLAIVLRDSIGWRGLFLIGALPLVFLFPLAWFKLPESPAWLIARGRVDEARAISSKTGIPLPVGTDRPNDAVAEKVGFRALASRQYIWGTALLGLMSFAGLLLTYGLNTWLPKIMENAGYNAKGSLSFLLVLNGGAIIGGLLAPRSRTSPVRSGLSQPPSAWPHSPCSCSHSGSRFPYSSPPLPSRVSEPSVLRF